MRGPTVGVLTGLTLLVVACGQIPSGSGGSGTSATPAPRASSAPGSAVPGTTSPGSTSGAPSGSSSAVPPSARPTTAAPRLSPSASEARCAAVPARLSLRGDSGRAFAFAPLDDPGDVVVEGRVSGSEAWSTSKVLVAAAFVATTVDGDPGELSAADRRLVAAALQRSDNDAVRTLRQRIPGAPGRAMTAVLRGIGDRTTDAPDSYEGLMTWSLREQVRFMTALTAGEVVSPATSAYLLATMRPVESHRWGLGTVGATTFKGGWLRQGRVTRQLGLLDSYAVAIITDQGPVVRQDDGDAAHVREMNELAALLADRLAWEQECGPR